MNEVPISRAGYDRLLEELNQLKNKDLPEVTKAIGVAREFGDISENAEFHAAKERQGIIMAKIADLNAKLAEARVIEPEKPDGRVIFGCTVTVYDLDQDKEFRYRIVGPFESNPDRAELSFSSPIGRALIGKEEGDEVKVKTPKGVRELEIVSIE